MDDLTFVNRALNEMGESALASLDDEINSAKIQTCVMQLDRVKQAVLRTRDWNCARTRKELAQVGADDSNDSLGEWSVAYRLPPDCLAVRRFISSYDYITYAKFSVELDSTGKPILYTNKGNGKIVYTKDLLDVNRWDPLLIDAAITRLAAQFAITFSRETKFVEALLAVYERKINEATSVDEAEGGIEEVYDRTLVNVRY